ncbi:alpha-galactosidase [Parerythrobacter jejuensis]|uniref:Alpha-galactosidase n=1 Tax=Parerythrobacter jejuensis TaxID=795812 RepID=A0A845AR64_9SPHN|nr:alpha-galactosidase [Parerythrobacter jejuensis]MXP31969.1 alpha-galactosidase [Parerythrobacter jejuensis]
MDRQTTPGTPTTAPDKYVHLECTGTMLILDAEPGQRPAVVYCGPSIVGADPAELALLATRQWAHGNALAPITATLMQELGTGIGGSPGLIVHRDGQDWAVDLRVERITRDTDCSVTVHCTDKHSAISVNNIIALDPASGVVRAKAVVTNDGGEDLAVDWCCALALPLDQKLQRITGFTGRWSGEFTREEVEIFRGSYLRENKAGRTSHDNFPGITLTTTATNENSGLAAAFHLGWSGNNRIRIDRQSDGRNFLQTGELLFPGEVILSAGESYTTPEMFAGFSRQGLSDVSRKLHAALTHSVLPQRALARPRPVHYNTWEAVYFGLSEERLITLAEDAAKVGAERFILDDGWFGSRRHDRAGLGDWWVSEDVFPNGLGPLVERVKALGMEFGIWFEPEMVNPDSDLYRAHPEWVLQAENVEQIPFRSQLTLDLSRTDVFEYLFSMISGIVSAHGVSYIKWDMNRETPHPGSGGRPAMHRQTHAVYRLIDALRDKHPDLEIESCSSGGGRADFGILQRADRIWASDNNDPRDRQGIERGASVFFPLRVIGSHVGPKHCHTTRRTYSMEFRAGTAIFGHMGLELDLRDETERDLATLAAAIKLYKQHRDLLHGGEFQRGDTAPYLNLIGVVAKDREEALFSCAQTDAHSTVLPERIYFTGLDAGRKYRVRLVWPLANPSVTAPSIIDHADLLGKGSVFGGASLMDYGMQVPLLYPDTCLIYHLEAEH